MGTHNEVSVGRLHRHHFLLVDSEVEWHAAVVGALELWHVEVSSHYHLDDGLRDLLWDTLVTGLHPDLKQEAHNGSASHKGLQNQVCNGRAMVQSGSATAGQWCSLDLKRQGNGTVWI